MYKNSSFQTNFQHSKENLSSALDLGAVHTYHDIFYVLTFYPQAHGVFGHPKTHLFINDLYSGDFWRRRLLVYVWADEKVFEYIIYQ